MQSYARTAGRRRPTDSHAASHSSFDLLFKLHENRRREQHCLPPEPYIPKERTKLARSEAELAAWLRGSAGWDTPEAQDLIAPWGSGFSVIVESHESRGG